MPAELIVPLDVPSSDRSRAIIDTLGDAISFYKVGLELYTAEGPAALDYLKESGKRIFLDLKLHDIPRTVAGAVASAARHGIDLLTVHAAGGREMLAAAAESAAGFGGDRPRLLAITTLTSLDDSNLAEIGIQRPLREHTLAMGKLAVDSGIDGLVCSPHEVSHLRETLGTDPIFVTPGVRPLGAEVADQKRVATPEMAVEAGATHLVIGRPITQAPDPRAAAEAILGEMQTP